MIKAEHLTKRFDTSPNVTLALDDFSTEIGPGSIYGLIGPNGSGKSTLLRLIAGVYQPDGGSLEVDGQSVFENGQVKERIFFVSDDFFYFPGSTVDEMAAFYAGFYPNWSWERYEELCGKFPIGRTQKIQTFSKGMARQAALLLGLSAQTQFLLLDEAFDGLDPIIRTAVRKILSDDVSRRDATVIITSHNLRELEDLCDHVGLVHRGSILFQKELDELKLGFCKVQAAFRPLPDPEELKKRLDVLSLETRGSLVHLVARGNSADVLALLEDYSPLFSEGLPLTLEEVFISEMEAIGYDYNNVLF